MDLHIFGIMAAVEFEPAVPTYAIRIELSGYEEHLRERLKASPLYVHIAEYFFDDVWPGMEGRNTVMFDDSLAERVLTEFAAHRDECQALLVHCTRGVNRSPAVALALNEIFGLGQDPEALKNQYGEANWFVYHKLKKVADRLGFR